MAEQKHGAGGHNKTTIMMTIKWFKSLCLNAQTKKATEIHEYYMKMEEVLHQIVEEETDELKQQLEQKNAVIQAVIQEKDSVIQSTKKEKQRAVEQAIIGQFPLNTECIYFGTIDNTNAATVTSRPRLNVVMSNTQIGQCHRYTLYDQSPTMVSCFTANTRLTNGLNSPPKSTSDVPSTTKMVAVVLVAVSVPCS